MDASWATYPKVIFSLLHVLHVPQHLAGRRVRRRRVRHVFIEFKGLLSRVYTLVVPGYRPEY